MVLTAQQFEVLMPDATQLESDEPEMESSKHYTQLLLLVSCLEWLWKDDNNFFIGANLTLYSSVKQLRHRDFRGPDFFLVKNTEKKPRKLWVVWEEDGKYPDLIIELLSDSTANIDRTLKKQLYQDIFRISEYFLFSPDTMELEGYHLQGAKYQPIIPDENNFYWSNNLGLFLGIHEEKLRYFSREKKLIPTPEESALEAQQRVSELEAKLRELGVNLE
ncbi:Uma2 family endonuclease [Geminocystis sp. CENA526]|uniref:Uma2 family endonuclease n=1 Tax=Geminocystis sp. CENA526 TaxID=1355871 RepID=UPI003D6E95B7